ncbi:MAG: DUF58 domain-containing protein [Acidobacteriota bacterium]|nr:DUF58 domain-containing protein [Acidobacteriota bacterium]
MSAPTAPGLRHLDPAVIAGLGSLELKARAIVEGFISGLHRSPYRGFSVEFAEYRPYLPGDDLATLDWKLYARTDRYYVRKYEEETNVECHLLVDISRSMNYGTGAMTKKEYAATLAASLAYLMQRQRDAAGLLAFDNDVVRRVPASARPGHLRLLLAELDRLPEGRESNVAKPLERLAAALVRRGMIVLISDLLDEPSRVIKGLELLRARGSDVVVFQILDRAELTFPFQDSTQFKDLETGAEVLTRAGDVRDEYLATLGRMLEQYAQAFGAAGIEYVRLDTHEPLDAALTAWLSARARRR